MQGNLKVHLDSCYSVDHYISVKILFLHVNFREQEICGILTYTSTLELSLECCHDWHYLFSLLRIKEIHWTIRECRTTHWICDHHLFINERPHGFVCIAFASRRAQKLGSLCVNLIDLVTETRLQQAVLVQFISPGIFILMVIINVCLLFKMSSPIESAMNINMIDIPRNPNFKIRV